MGTFISRETPSVKVINTADMLLKQKLGTDVPMLWTPLMKEHNGHSYMGQCTVRDTDVIIDTLGSSYPNLEFLAEYEDFDSMPSTLTTLCYRAR